MLFRFLQRLSRANHAAAEAPHHSFQALSAGTLLKPFQGEVSAIRRQVGVPPEYWDQLYYPVIRNYARLVQKLPASESDHHATAGGLLEYGLTTTRYSLKLKEGIVLPPGAAPEAQAKVQDLWTYACFIAAFLQGLGKPIIEQQIRLRDKAGSVSRAWTLLNGPMPKGGRYYIGFNHCREPQQHPRIPPLLAQYLLPPEGLTWIASDTDVLLAWLAAIEGDISGTGPVGDIISQAEGLASTRNVSTSDARHFYPDFERRRVKFSLTPTQQ